MHSESRIDTPDGSKLFCTKDIPESQRAAIVLVHGLCEHSGRYDYVVQKLNSFGCGVYRFDNKGHGRSEGKRGYLDDFQTFIDDADLVVEMAGRENPDIPLFMLGHSMGGFITAGYGVKYPGKLAGQIFSGPAIIELDIFDPLKEMDVDKEPEAKIPNSLSHLISRDQKVVVDYENDPLNLKETCLKLLTTVFFDGVAWLKDNLGKYQYPCLILHGGDDQIVDNASSRHLYDNISSIDKNMKIYKDNFHEILNEPEKDQVLADIESWLDQRI